jgi:hypothetical protein
VVSNAAGFVELIFLVLVFAIYLLLARRPGQGPRKGMVRTCDPLRSIAHAKD